MLKFGLALFFTLVSLFLQGQTMDSVIHHSPKKAAIKSACLPGLGQAYNQKYWKIPVAYTLMGGALYFHFDQKKEFNAAKSNYQAKWYYEQNKATQPQLIDPFPTNSLSSLSSEKMRLKNSKDLGIILLVLAYGLQIADATVDAHLFEFNVSDDLSVRPTFNFDGATNSTQLGLSLRIR
ncbi:MAG: DUF5683 domain-containing protein [Bacteroidia bacterium]|jgi:hypothetical protein